MKINATSVALNGKAYVIMGESGAGKSALALALIHRGATLIADDMTMIQDGIAYSPKEYSGWLEVRGIGLISGFSVCPSAKVGAFIRLIPDKPERLPDIKQGQIPEFCLWTKDRYQADKVMVIDAVLRQKLKVE
ncbi:MAG: aldolase [Pseudomonadota bacterium]|nr:aldolase [Pseudomonadota bacterium]